MTLCHKCGWKLPEDAVFCPGCGTPVVHEGALLLSDFRKGSQPSYSYRDFDHDALQKLADPFFASLPTPLHNFDKPPAEARLEAMRRLGCLLTELGWRDEKPARFDESASLSLGGTRLSYRYGCIEDFCYDGGNMLETISPCVLDVDLLTYEEYEKKRRKAIEEENKWQQVTPDSHLKQRENTIRSWYFSGNYPLINNTEAYLFRNALLLKEPLGIKGCLLIERVFL